MRTMRIGDLNPLSVALAEESGAAVDLSGQTVTARMVNVATGAVVIDDRSCTIDNAAAGYVTLAFSAGDTALGDEGIYDVTFRATNGTNPRTFPARGPLKLEILPR